MSPKKGHFAGDAEGARQYLANVAAAGLWTPNKPLGEYKDRQVLRKANAFKVQEQAGVPLSNKAARGHADLLPQRPAAPPSKRVGVAPAPGKGAAPRPTAPKPRKDVTIIPPPKMPMEQRIQGARGSSQLNTTRFANVIKELRRVERERGGDAKVYFRLWDNRQGEWRKLYVYKGAFNSPNNGVPVGELLDRVREKVKSGKAKTERDALLQVWQEDIEGDVAGEDTPDDVTMPEVFTVFSVHVMAG